MTTRRWLVAVVFTAALLGAFVMWRRPIYFRQLAGLHQFIALQLRCTTRLGGDLSAAKHNERMAKMYQRAASRPWLPVEPEPPEPE
jgi:hypothetical protein